MIIRSFQAKKRARIEIIPLIDIVFFLLATFMMVSVSMVKNQGVPVNLPSAETGSKQSKDSNYTAITVTEKGEIYFNKKLVSIQELPGYFKKLKAEQNDPLVLLNGDEKALFGKTVLVLDEARKQGIHRVALQTKQP